jgi:hypothetical protein
MTLAAQDYPAPAPGARAFRDALGRFATGVAFLTAVPDGEPAGLIVNSHPPSHVTTFEVLCRAAKRGRGPREGSGWGEHLVSKSFHNRLMSDVLQARLDASTAASRCRT